MSCLFGIKIKETNKERIKIYLVEEIKINLFL
jgi:hypothetical protein